MRKIFISYRRADTEFHAGALGRDLRRLFGGSRSSGTKRTSVAEYLEVGGTRRNRQETSVRPSRNML